MTRKKGEAHFFYTNKDSPDYVGVYGTVYTDRQLAILNGEIPLSEVRPNELSCLYKKAKNKGDMGPQDAYELLEAIATISGSQDKLKKIKAVTPALQQKAKRPPVNFSKCNIPVGAELVYVDDANIKVTEVNDRKVMYNNELTSLSAIAKMVKGYPIAGPMCFTYNGKLVSDIAEETQWKE